MHDLRSSLGECGGDSAVASLGPRGSGFPCPAGFRDPCFFDPPPGDQFTRSITNDSPRRVSLVDGDDERCRRGCNSADTRTGDKADVIVEACSVETFAVVDPQTHLVLGCLDEPGDELNPAKSAVGRQVSRHHPCAGSGGVPLRITVYDPSR